jgi:hypothetical protein
MKESKTVRALIGAVALSFAFAVHTFAIEGIQDSVQSSNAVLSWPSATNETYIVQYMGTLQATDAWLTLTDGFPAALNTNITTFVDDSNLVQYSPPSTNNDTNIIILNPGQPITNMIPPGTISEVSSTTGFYRVVRDGVHIFGLTNGMVLSGNVQFPIEFGVDTTDEIVGVTFYDTNDNPVIGASATPGPGGGWILNWDTSMFPNGSDAIEAELDFATTNPVVSLPLIVTVNNLISFPNYLTQLYGSQMWVYAQTLPNTDVEIDIYDENTNYLGSFYPVSDGNGVISFLWDLTDGEGHTFNDTNFLGVFTVESSPSVIQSANLKTVNTASPNFTPPSTKETLVQKVKADGASPDTSPGASAVKPWTQEPTWTPNNYWVIGVGDIDSIVANYAVYGGSASPDDDGGVFGTLQDLHANMAPGNNYSQWGDEYFVTDPISRSNLLVYLASQSPRYENFFWFGHGTEQQISAYEAGTAITDYQIAYALDNVPLSYSIRKVANHVYRFIWMESCDTALGNFCESFGIPAQDLSTNYFIDCGIESRAYLGYKNEIGFNPSFDQGGNTSWDQQSKMWNIFLSNFLVGNFSLEAGVYAAQNNQGPFQGNTVFRMDSSATSYGATDLIYPNPW